MESRLKIRISRVFRSSFGSCRSRSMSDVVGQPVFVAQDPDFDLVDPYCNEDQLFPSKCAEMQGKEVLYRRKVSDSGVYFVSGGKEGRTCPPASPISPGNPLVKLHEKERKERKKKVKKPKKPHHKKRECEGYNGFSSYYSKETKKNGWFSSEDETEDETETFFSSKSLTSDSSSCRPPRRNKRSTQRRRAKNMVPGMGLCPLVTKGMVEESVAVVKRSKDPYNDFMTSMVEMIIERQIFSAKDLEKLLQCFLSLNSPHHHRIIVEAFTEIWEALFSTT